MKSNKRPFILLGILCATAACAKLDTSGAAATDSSKGGARSGNDSSVSASASMDTATTVTSTGYGELQIGMTVANAAVALQAPVPSMAGADTACSYVHFATQPAGMRIMVVRDTVARIEIDSGNVATGLGARVGDPESHIHELYGSRVSVQPHKYDTAGHYLIVNHAPDTDHGLKLVFETDGNRVTKYRAGRMPEVEYVEGCS